MRTRIFALALLPALLPTLLCTAPSLAADATSFDPTKVQITAKATSSIPVGTVVTWPSGANPADMQNPDGTYNWLECNGQSISQTVYPELFAVIGGKTPDYRSWFLRGGTAGQAGNEAQDSIRSHAHELTEHAHTLSIKDAASKDDVASMTPIYDTVNVGGISGTPMTKITFTTNAAWGMYESEYLQYKCPAYGVYEYINAFRISHQKENVSGSVNIPCGYPFYVRTTSNSTGRQVSITVKEKGVEYYETLFSAFLSVISTPKISGSSSSITYVSGMKMAPGSSTVSGTTDPGGAGQTRETGGVETAPKHKFVRYLIRARP